MGAWRSILDGVSAANARAAAKEIAAAVSRWEPDGASLADGAAGMALFLSYYAAAFEDAGAEQRATELLERAIEMLADAPMHEALYGGIAGVAWAIEHLAGADPDDDDDDPNAAIDEALAELLARGSWQGQYDLISGLVGIAVYALERLPRAGAVRLVEAICGHLDRLSESTDTGVTWYTRPELVPGAQWQPAPDGYYNLGLAHGVPGVLAVLAKAAAAGVAAERARALFDGGLSWVLAQRISGDARGCFPMWIDGSADDREPGRLAWCYGDLGLSAALLAGGRAIGSARAEQAAVEVALAAAARPPEHAHVTDMGLCHGALGNAHIFNRLYQASGEARFLDAARSWVDRGLAMRRSDGVAGFPSFTRDRDGTGHWLADAGFLTGAAGAGLALVAACSHIEPSWDRVLLVDIPGPADG